MLKSSIKFAKEVLSKKPKSIVQPHQSLDIELSPLAKYMCIGYGVAAFGTFTYKTYSGGKTRLNSYRRFKAASEDDQQYYSCYYKEYKSEMDAIRHGCSEYAIFNLFAGVLFPCTWTIDTIPYIVTRLNKKCPPST